jgi:hypothetical protein
LLALLALFAAVPAFAAGDIYKWTDAQGHTVISDLAPVDPGKVSGLTLLVPASKRAAQAPGTVAVSADSRREQELEARVEELEREMQEQQTRVQSGDADAYYPPPPAPPASAFGTDDHYGDDQAYFPAAYPAYFYASPAYSVVAVRTKTERHRRVPTSKPGFPPRPRGERPAVITTPFAPQFLGPTPQFIGPTPNFIGPTPKFTGPTPQFTGPTPQFVSSASHPVGGHAPRFVAPPILRTPRFMNGQPRFANPVPQVHAPPPANAPQRPRR